MNKSLSSDGFFNFFKVICIFSVFIAQAEEFNLDFESVEDDQAVGWDIYGSDGGYLTSVDDQIIQNGQYSATIEWNGEPIESDDGSQFKAWGYSVPAIYEGKKIKLTGQIKTENVKGGYAGLWLRIDPGLSFDNMANRGVTGTTDWQQYEIELDLNASVATQIVSGGLMTGSGQMWFDNLQLSIDGTPIEKAPLKELTAADKDQEFDSGSRISINTLSKQQLENLTLLGKLWGFLKYHHPSIAQSKYNWDYELFRFLPKYLDVGNDRDDLLMGWIDSLGDIEICEKCEDIRVDSVLKPDLSWINHGLSAELKTKLLHVYNSRNYGVHHYIGFAGPGNAEFKNEKQYADMRYPDDGFRLLAAYRYWNMIHYYFPYKNLMDNDWNHILKKYIPLFLEAKNELAYELVMVAMIGEVQDSHATLRSRAIENSKGKLFPPVHVKFIKEQLVVDDYFNADMKKEVGLELGDVITHINEKSVQEIIEELLPQYSGSNYPSQLRNMSLDILRFDDKKSQLKIMRKSKSMTVTIPMFELKDLDYYNWYRDDADGKSYKLMDDNIGYITLKNIKAEDVSNIRKAFKKTQGIIIDIRNYPSASMPFTLGAFFTSESKVFTRFTGPVYNNPGEFFFAASLNVPKSIDTYQGPLVVMVNEVTQSHAEFTTMAFQAGERTTVIGSTTAGADGNVSIINLPGGLTTSISGIGVYYPDGGETQRVGVRIDEVVLPSVQGIREGRDELLDRAIEIIKSK